MPLKVVGPHLWRLIDILPLGVRMLWKGKVPSPLHPKLNGVERIRALLERTGVRGEVSHLRPHVPGEKDG